MKIGIDARLSEQTGVGRYIRNLYTNLLKTNKPDKSNKFELMRPKIRWHSLAEQLFFPFWLLFKNYDLVHFTYFSFPIFCPKKFIITIHDLIPWHFKTGKASQLPQPIYYLKHFFYKLVLWFGVRRAEKIIAVSEATKREIVDHLKIHPQKIKVIYEAADNNKFKITMQNLKFNKYFLYVGNAYPHKNLEELIDAFKEIENYKLVLVGPDDYFYQKLKTWVFKKNLQDKIIFYGQASDKELLCLYRQAKVFINPSLMEGFGLPGLEAMAVGCPVICSDIGVFREIYGKAATYFTVREIGGIRKIREKIEEFLSLSAKEKQRLINVGKMQAEKYSWEKCGRQTLEVYESCFGL